MKTCSSCKFWYDGRECTRTDSAGVDGPIKESPVMFTMHVSVDDDSGLGYKLLTGPDFGCVLHEPK